MYLQLSRKLISAIQAGQWKAGEALPSERMLVDALGISRVTARRALQLLAERGLVIRSRGAGTFITPLAVHQPARVDRFSELAQRHGLVPHSELLSFERRRAEADEACALGITQCDEVVRLTRLRKAGGKTYWMDVSTLPAPILPDASMIGESLYAYLDKIGKPVLRVSEQLQAIVATEQVAARLGIGPGEPLLLVIRTGYSHDEQPVEWTAGYCLNEFCGLIPFPLRSSPRNWSAGSGAPGQAQPAK